LIDRFVNTETFRVVGESKPGAAESEMRKGRAYAALDIPRTLLANLTQAIPRSAIACRRIQFHDSSPGSKHWPRVALTQSVESLLRETATRMPIDIGRRCFTTCDAPPNFYVPA